MGLQPPRQSALPKIQRLSVRNWLKGYNSQLDEGRTPNEGLTSAVNVLLDQDGTIRPRPSLIKYGQPLPGTVLGEIFEFVKSDTLQNYIMGVFNVSGTAQVWYSKDGGVWTVATGKTYSTTAKCHFAQADNKVLIMNGSDNLSYLNIPTLAVVPFVSLSTPAAPTITRTGLSGTTYTYYYKITANSTVGETAASLEASQQTSLIRGSWDATTNYLTLNWTAVTGAVSYNVYQSEVSGSEVLIASGINGLSFKDDGTSPRDVTHTAPLADTTQGPKVTRATVINGQIFMTGDADNTRYVRFGGTGQYVLDFSPFNGGGWVEIGRGTKEFPVIVKSFRTGQGTPVITILCQGTNGSGKRYTLSPANVTVGDTVINYFQIQEDNGQDGTDSPDGVVLYRDSLWYPSRDGFKTTGTRAQLQNILSTTDISTAVQTDISNLNINAMGNCVGLANSGRIYWALPVGAMNNNQIWVLDLDRQAAWMLPLTISADWQLLYGDNSGITHHLILSNNTLYELSDYQSTIDDTTAFGTSITSGQLRFSDDGMDWAKVIDVTFVLLRPRGLINVSVSGKTEDSALATVGSQTFQTLTSVAGWGEYGWANTNGWSVTETVPTVYGNSRVQQVLEIDEELNWLTWNINSTVGNTFYQVSDVIVRYVIIGVVDLT